MSKGKMILLDVILGILVAVLIVGNGLALSFSGLISIYLNQETWTTEQVGEVDPEELQYYKSEYTTARELRAAQEAFARDLQAESTVLLQNSGDTLPLAKGAAVTLLGAGSAMDQFMLGGIGSGAIDTSSLTMTLQGAFEAAGYSVNQTMVDFYAVGAGSSYRRASATGSINEAPVSLFGADEVASFAQYNDAGIVVIGREAGEGQDILFTTTDNPEKHMLQLSDEELELIRYSCDTFDKTVVLINTTMAMQLGELSSLDLACLYIGGGGMSGFEAIPEILNGTRYPSGHLADTYVYDSLSAPSIPNYASFELAKPAGDTSTFADSTYVLYQEGIYVGYRYYETRYEDAVLGQGNAGDYDYAQTVQYPFGYGLSYTQFEHSGFTAREEGDNFVFELTVTNAGDAAGKDVVQIYMQSPYTDYDRQNGVEKAAVTLAGFAKTQELAAGQSETVTVTVPKSYMRSYDANNAKTYIVDAGTYYFAAGSDAHDALNNILAQKGLTVADGMTAEGDTEMVWPYEQQEFDDETYSYGENGEKITNRFDDVDLAYYMDDVVYLSRSDWEGTFPNYGNEHQSLTVTSAMIEAYSVKHTEDAEAEMPATGQQNGLVLASMIGLPYDHESWELLLDEMTAEEMMTLVENGGYLTREVLSIQKPATLDKDGPAGITSTLIGGAGCFGFPIEMLVACSWNTEMMERLGELVGEDSLFARVPGWYAPGLNTHRSPFNGRNYEYYSEDPVLGTKIGTAVVIGAQSKGAYCYIKHFALDDQGIGGAYTFCNEQAVREIYLRQFEETVTVGDARACMTNNGRVGMTWCGRNKGMMTDVLRGEWGFEGFVITDQCTANRSEALDIWDGMACGTDLWLNAAEGTWVIEGYASNPTVMNLLRNASKNILYTVANSNAMNGIGANTRVVPVMPAWQVWLIVIDVVAGVLILGGAAAAFAFYMKKHVLVEKKKEDK